MLWLAGGGGGAQTRVWGSSVGFPAAHDSNTLGPIRSKYSFPSRPRLCVLGFWGGVELSQLKPRKVGLGRIRIEVSKPREGKGQFPLRTPKLTLPFGSRRQKRARGPGVWLCLNRCWRRKTLSQECVHLLDRIRPEFFGAAVDARRLQQAKSHKISWDDHRSKLQPCKDARGLQVFNLFQGNLKGCLSGTRRTYKSGVGSKHLDLHLQVVESRNFPYAFGNPGFSSENQVMFRNPLLCGILG